MRQVLLVVLFTTTLVGCSQGTEKREADAQLKTAIVRAMCAPNTDDLKLALGDIAVASDVVDLKARKGRVAEIADQITSADCPGSPSNPPNSALKSPAAPKP